MTGKKFGKSSIMLIAAVLLLSGGTSAFARGDREQQAPNGPGYGPGYRQGPGMMGPGYDGDERGYGPGFGGYGPGMMGPGYGGRRGGMMGPGYNGYGPGMMGPGMMGQGYGPGMAGPGYGFGNPENAQHISDSAAAEAVANALAAYRDPNLEVAEIMEFQYNYYAQIKEKGSDMNAFELLVNPYTGQVFPEPGPNMMWNTKYGHMSGWPYNSDSKNEVSAAKAEELAVQFVKQYSSTATVGDAEPFPGYYTLHVLEQGKIVGMLSVNAQTGAVWYHNWHGNFIKMVENHEGS